MTRMNKLNELCWGKRMQRAMNIMGYTCGVVLLAIIIVSAIVRAF